MLKAYDMKIEDEEARDAFAEIRSEGYLPGERVSRRLIIPVNCPFGPDKVVARYSFYPDFCLDSIVVRCGPPVVPLDELLEDEPTLMSLALVEVSGVIPEDIEPGKYRCKGIEITDGIQEISLDDLLDLCEYLPRDVVDKARWPRDIYIGWE
jgi:hypothetical protein